MMLGSTPQLAYDRIRARAGTPSSLARSALIRIAAAPASFIPDELPARDSPVYLEGRA